MLDACLRMTCNCCGCVTIYKMNVQGATQIVRADWINDDKEQLDFCSERCKEEYAKRVNEFMRGPKIVKTKE